MKKMRRDSGTRAASLDVSESPLEGIVEAYESNPQDLSRQGGIVIGALEGFDEEGCPRVSFPGCPGGDGRLARSVAALRGEDVGQEVALMFEEGDPGRPLVLGLIQSPAAGGRQRSLRVRIDDDRLVIDAEREIVLRCGKASITLTRAGKVILRGAYLLSRSSGVNRIKGGSVQIN